MAGGDEAFGNGFDNLLMNLVEGEVALDEDYALGFTCGNLAVLEPDAAIEGFLLLLEAAFVLAGLRSSALIAMTGAVEALSLIHI